MVVRKLMLAVAALATVATAVPAQAGELAGVNEGLFGAVCVEASEDDGPFTFRVEACVSFSGVLTPNNTLVVQYYGMASSVTSHPVKVPQITWIKAKIKNASGNSTDTDVLLNGNASAVASSTALAEDGPKEWPVEDITVCVEAFGLFGNASPVRVDMAEHCETPQP